MKSERSTGIRRVKSEGNAQRGKAPARHSATAVPLNVQQIQADYDELVSMAKASQQAFYAKMDQSNEGRPRTSQEVARTITNGDWPRLVTQGMQLVPHDANVEQIH